MRYFFKSEYAYSNAPDLDSCLHSIGELAKKFELKNDWTLDQILTGQTPIFNGLYNKISSPKFQKHYGTSLADLLVGNRLFRVDAEPLDKTEEAKTRVNVDAFLGGFQRGKNALFKHEVTPEVLISLFVALNKFRDSAVLSPPHFFQFQEKNKVDPNKIILVPGLRVRARVPRIAGPTDETVLAYRIGDSGYTERIRIKITDTRELHFSAITQDSPRTPGWNKEAAHQPRLFNFIIEEYGRRTSPL